MKTNLSFKIIVLLIISTLLLNSCATIFSNNNEQILIFTDAKDVSIIVNNRFITNTMKINEQDIIQYPMFKLDESKNSKYLLILQTNDLITLKKEGYKDRTLRIEKSTKYGAIVADVLVGSVLGFVFLAVAAVSSVYGDSSGEPWVWGAASLISFVAPLGIDIATSNLTYYSDNIIYVNMELEPTK